MLKLALSVSEHFLPNLHCWKQIHSDWISTAAEGSHFVQLTLGISKCSDKLSNWLLKSCKITEFNVKFVLNNLYLNTGVHFSNYTTRTNLDIKEAWSQFFFFFNFQILIFTMFNYISNGQQKGSLEYSKRIDLQGRSISWQKTVPFAFPEHL